MNITNGQSSIVCVQHNKIVGRLDSHGECSSCNGPSSSSLQFPGGDVGKVEWSPRQSPLRDSPARGSALSEEREGEYSVTKVIV